MMRSRAIVFLALLGVAGPAPATGWLYDASAGLTVHDNLGRARLAADRLGATALELDFNAQYQPAWRTDGVFTLDLFGGADLFDRASDLGQTRLGAGAAYLEKLGLGREAPWWRVDVQASYHEFKDDARSGPAWQVGLAAGRAWNAGFDLRGRLDYRRHHGVGGDTGLDPESVFDLAGWTLRADGGWAVGPGWAITAGLGFRRGDINTSTTQPGGEVGRWTDDPAFGPGWRTYRVDARVVTLTLGADVALGTATQLIMAWDTLDARSRTTGFDYDSDLYRLQIQHEF